MVIHSRYEVDFTKPPLGSGSMGIVHRAIDLRLDRRPVALKTVKDVTNAQLLELFERDWKSIARIEHENVVRILDQGRFDDRGVSRPFIIMEYLDGVTLDKLIQQSSSRLTVENTLEFIHQLCNGLERIHREGLVHRDLKPANIFITKDNKVKLIDFGLAHVAKGNEGTSIKGTPLYMAPEQIRGKPPTALSDQFSLGVVIYEALTGQRPFHGRTDGEIRDAILGDTPPPAAQINPNISPLISCVIHKALAKKDQQRFANIRIFSETLQKASQGGPIEIFNPSGVHDRLERVRQYFNSGELDHASKILGTIEAEGYFDDEIKILRGQIKQRQRQREVNQHLESARAYMETSEFHLALEEIQAALEKDKGNVEALGLQRTVEARSGEIKAEKWQQLAEEHFENRLYDKAREAVDQVLRLRPGDERAVALRIRIERAEREEAGIRSQKQLNYEKAVQAFERGDLESAFSRMESLFRLGQASQGKMPHDSDSKYEKFFNQVRSAQDEITRAYNDGRRQLAEKNYPEVIRICSEVLNRYPGNGQFKALRVDAEDQEQRDLSAYIAEIGRRVELEPDLDKKVGILEEATERYPQEAHFTNKLKSTRYRRDTVRSIIDQKAIFEAQGNFAAVLTQLKALQQIHSQYPGLEREMERIERRLGEQREEEKKAEWERQVQQEIDVGDWQRAGELLREAQAEFKDDAGLNAMEALIVRAKERVDEAWRLLAEGRGLLERGESEGVLVAFRRARELDSRDAALLAQISNLCAERAEKVYERDWESAERLIEEALLCSPVNQAAKELKVKLREQKRRYVVDLCLTQARQLEADGKIAEALFVVQDGLAAYADDIRLQQLRDRYYGLRPDLLPKTRTEPPRAGDPSLRHSEAEPDAQEAAPSSALGSIVVDSSMMMDESSVEVEGAQDAGNKEVSRRSRFSSVLLRLRSSLGVQVRRIERGQNDNKAPRPDFRPSGDDELVETRSAKFQSWVRNVSGIYWILLSAGIFVLLIFGTTGVLSGTKAKVAQNLSTWWRSTKSSSSAVPVHVEVQASPSEAVVHINGQGQVGVDGIDLKPGSYVFEATLEGFQPARKAVLIAPQTRRGGLRALLQWVRPLGRADSQPAGQARSESVQLVLRPLPPALRVVTDTPIGAVSLDNAASVALQEGQFGLEDVTGMHQLQVKAAMLEVTIPFNAAPGTAPVLTEGFTAKGFRAILVASFRGRGHVYCTCSGVSMALDGQPAGEIGPQGIDIAVPSGHHELSIAGTDKQPWKADVDIGAAPALFAHLSSPTAERNVGGLEVSSGEENIDAFADVRVFVDGQERKQASKQKGKLYVYNIEAGRRAIRLEKPGYHPYESSVDIRKNQTSALRAVLDRIPVMATLHIRNIPAGMQIAVDGTRYPIGPDGNLALQVSAGEHRVDLQRPGYQSLSRSVPLVEGQDYVLPDSLLAMEKIPVATTGRVNLTRFPPNSRITYQQEGGSETLVDGATVELSDGSYTFRASAPDFQSRSLPVRVVAGQTIPVNLSLSPSVIAREPSTKRSVMVGMEGWDKSLWSGPENGWYARKMSGQVLFTAHSLTGDLEFSARRAGGLHIPGLGSPRVKWLIGYLDPRNYDLFSIDREAVYWRRYTNGKPGPEAKQKHGVMIKEDTYTLDIHLTAGDLVLRIYDGEQWKVLPTLVQPGKDLTDGQFGFWIDDELRLGRFRYTPSPEP